MCNLIFKDLAIQKKNLIIVFLYSIFGAYFFINIPYGAFTIISVATVYILSQGAFTLDEKTNAEMMINSLPVDRKTVVQAKYLSIYIYFIASIIMYFIVSYGYMLLFKNNVLISSLKLEVFTAGFIGVIINTGISFPIYFKVGILKSRYLIMFIFLGTFGLAGALSGIISDIMAKNNTNNALNLGVYGVIITIIIGIIMHFLSYILSLRLYENREF